MALARVLLIGFPVVAARVGPAKDACCEPISRAGRMMQGIGATVGFEPVDGGRSARRILARTAPGVLALGLSVAFGAWFLHMRPADFHHIANAPEAGSAPVETTVAASAPASPYGQLFDPRLVSGAAPGSLAQNFTLDAKIESSPPDLSVASLEPDAAPPSPAIDDGAPLPPPRPAELAPPAGRGQPPARRLAQQNRTAPPPAAEDSRNFFEKLFGALQPNGQPNAQPAGRPGGQALAYAAPDGGVQSGAQSAVQRALQSATPAPLRSLAASPPPGVDRQTAVYNVAAHTVTLPNGTQLEAHSGLGPMMDDPRHVNQPMRGPTPPNVYELSPRESLFHGVQALRLKPVGNGNLYGRNGLLAHTYMLGPKGASNGCVSFRNYNAFLQAYQNGEIRRLVVVAGM
jgi:hypothetical protein